MKHKHCDVIKAWADGRGVQFLCEADGEWKDLAYPNFHTYHEYRVKPEPKPDFVKGLYVSPAVMFSPASEPNLILTFDGETHKLKSAEVVGQP